MREILFRGKSEELGRWFCGFYWETSSGIPFIREKTEKSVSDHRVMKETVGQYTGMNDANDKKVFEGDIMLFSPFTIETGIFPSHYALVVWGDVGWELQEKNCSGADVLDADAAENAVVVGNIYDSPELLEVNHD